MTLASEKHVQKPCNTQYLKPLAMRLQAMLSQINHTRLVITTHSLNGVSSDPNFNMYTRSSSFAKDNLTVD
jgi:hypothetical protein